ncbi:MAG: SurA N-terminal domain-containing protein [Xanthobacteraceae bacterium]
MTSSLRLIGAVLFVVTVAFAEPAAAQVMVMVNGDPITAYDIDQRTKFNQLASRKTPSRQEVLDELIDEKLKIQQGPRYKLQISNQDVESSYAQMAQRMNLSADQLTQMLGRAGVQPDTLKSRIRADITWQQIVRGKFKSSFQFRDKDILAMIENKDSSGEGADGKVTAYDYAIRPILFIVPKGSSKAQFDARQREAEAMRARFDGCDRGLDFARALKGVIVRNQVTRTSTDLPAPLRELLERTGVGRLTTPEKTENGIQVFAICSKREITVDAPEMRKARQELFSKQFEKKSKRFLAELRRSAMIETK